MVLKNTAISIGGYSVACGPMSCSELTCSTYSLFGESAQFNSGLVSPAGIQITRLCDGYSTLY